MAMLERGLRAALVALLCACAPEAASWQRDTPRAPERPSTASRWVIASAQRPDLDAFVARQARQARALGLRPIVHVRTDWNTGIYLREHRLHPAVVEALRGFFLIEIDWDSTCLERDCPSVWGSGGYCVSWAQALHAVGPDGKPAPPSATPGKFGPRTAEENAAMLDDYRDLLDRWNLMPVSDRDACHRLDFRGH